MSPALRTKYGGLRFRIYEGLSRCGQNNKRSGFTVEGKCADVQKKGNLYLIA